MSIPLDRLYQYIENAANNFTKDTIIYRFYPHGSKKLKDLWPLQDYSKQLYAKSPYIICHDQEPLYYDLYQNSTILDFKQAPALVQLIQKK